MPLDRFVLILVLAVLAAGATIFLAAFAVAAVELPRLGAALAVPLLLGGYVIWRVVAERIRDREDGRYDRIER